MAQFPPAQMYAKDDSLKNKNFPPSPFTRMYPHGPPPPIRPNPPNSNGPSPPAVQPNQHQPEPHNHKSESFERFRMNPSPEVFVPGHRKRPSTPGRVMANF